STVSTISAVTSFLNFATWLRAIAVRILSSFDMALTQRELRQPHDFAPLEGGLVGDDADAGPVGGEGGVGPGVAAGGEGGDELVDEVRMRAAVAAPLNE